MPGRAPSRPCTTPSCGSASGRDCASTARSCSSDRAGCTIEIGAGTGLNLAHYPDDLDELVLVEPDAAMRRRLAERLARSRRRARLVDAPAEQLPFPDGSIDTVVSTFVLCTVDAPDLALREIVRVLQPDGQLLFIEHVRSDSPRLARWQDRLAKPWRRFARGCRCNRATSELMAACGFELDDLDDAVMARDAADRATAHHRPSTQDGSSDRDDELTRRRRNLVGEHERWIDRWLTSASGSSRQSRRSPAVRSCVRSSLARRRSASTISASAIT